MNTCCRIVSTLAGGEVALCREKWRYVNTVYDLEHEPPITPAETVLHPVPDAAVTPNYFVCILMDTAT